MKLLTLETTDSLYHPSGVMLEGYGRKYDFNYDNYQVDPRPSVLILGHWRHPRTRNQLVAGVNLNYLTDVEIEQLRRTLPQILKSRNLKDRYWAGRQLLPSVFNDNYRTYDKKFVHAVTPGTLRFWSKKAEAEKQKKQGEVAKQKELAALARARVPEIEPEPEPAVEPDEPEVSPESGVTAQGATQARP